MSNKRGQQHSSKLQSEGESTDTVMHMEKRKAKEIQESGTVIEKSIDLLQKEILDCQKHTKALQQEITHLSGLKHKLKGKLVLLPF